MVVHITPLERRKRKKLTNNLKWDYLIPVKFAILNRDKAVVHGTVE